MGHCSDNSHNLCIGDGVAEITKNRTFFMRLMENKIVTDFGFSAYQLLLFLNTSDLLYIQDHF
jgi:hypothetical protein